MRLLSQGTADLVSLVEIEGPWWWFNGSFVGGLTGVLLVSLVEIEGPCWCINGILILRVCGFDPVSIGKSFAWVSIGNGEISRWNWVCFGLAGERGFGRIWVIQVRLGVGELEMGFDGRFWWFRWDLMVGFDGKFCWFLWDELYFRANKRWVSIYGGEGLRSEVMVFGNRSEEAWDRRGVDERSNSLGFYWLYIFLGFILFWFLIVLVEVMPQSSMVSQGSHGNIMSNMVNNPLSVFILAFYVGFNSQILYVSYIICVIEILIKGMYRLDMMVIDGGRNLLRLWFFFRLYLGFEFLGLSFGGIYIVDWEVLLEFEIVSVAVWSWTADQRGFRLKTIEERRSGEGVFNRWFSDDRRRRALSTLPWAIVGGRNISKSYDVGRLILDFECMEWSFIGCNKRFYNSLISGFSWLDVDTLRVRISMVNCNLVSLRNNQGNEGHNPTHHGTVKGLTGGRNPLNRKVDNK